MEGGGWPRSHLLILARNSKVRLGKEEIGLERS